MTFYQNSDFPKPMWLVSKHSSQSRMPNQKARHTMTKLEELQKSRQIMQHYNSMRVMNEKESLVTVPKKKETPYK